MSFHNKPMGLSYFINLSEVKKDIMKFLREKLDSYGLHAVSFELSMGDDSMHLYFPAFDSSSKNFITPLEDLHFSDDVHENFKVALDWMIGVPTDYTIDITKSGMIIELYKEPQVIMDNIQSLFDDIDSMTADEAKAQIGLLYKKLKDNYGW